MRSRHTNQHPQIPNSISYKREEAVHSRRAFSVKSRRRSMLSQNEDSLWGSVIRDGRVINVKNGAGR